MEHKTCTLHQRKVNYYQTGSGTDLLFLHGYGASPKYYSKLIDLLAKHYRVTAPEIFGINSGTGSTPTTLDECTQVVQEFITATSITPRYIVAHSTGGWAALLLGSCINNIEKLILLNPLLPVNFGVLGFMFRSCFKYLRALTGISGWYASFRYAIWLLGPLLQSANQGTRSLMLLIKDIARFSLSTYDQPLQTVMLYGMQDEYFNPQKYLDYLRGKPNITFHQFPTLSHDWPIFYQEKAAEEVLGNLT